MEYKELDYLDYKKWLLVILLSLLHIKCLIFSAYLYSSIRPLTFYIFYHLHLVYLPIIINLFPNKMSAYGIMKGNNILSSIENR